MQVPDDIPFARLVGLERPWPGEAAVLALPAGPQFSNHLGTIHAAAQLTLAETASGAYLLREFGDLPRLLPVVRRVHAKFRSPARGRLTAHVQLSAEEQIRIRAALAGRGRVSFVVPAEVRDAAGTVTMTARIFWHVVHADSLRSATRDSSDP